MKHFMFFLSASTFIMSFDGRGNSVSKHWLDSVGPEGSSKGLNACLR